MHLCNCGSQTANSDDDFSESSKWAISWDPEKLELIQFATNTLRTPSNIDAIEQNPLFSSFIDQWKKEIFSLCFDCSTTSFNNLNDYKNDPGKLAWENIDNNEKKTALAAWLSCSRKWSSFSSKYKTHPKLLRIIRALERKITEDSHKIITDNYMLISESDLIIIKNRIFRKIFGKNANYLFDTNFYSTHLNFLKEFSILSPGIREELRVHEEINALIILAHSYTTSYKPSSESIETATNTDEAAKKQFFDEVELLGEKLLKEKLIQLVGKPAAKKIIFQIKNNSEKINIPKKSKIITEELKEIIDQLKAKHHSKLAAWQTFITRKSHIDMQMALSEKSTHKESPEHHEECSDEVRIRIYEETLSQNVEARYQEFISKKTEIQQYINTVFSNIESEQLETMSLLSNKESDQLKNKLLRKLSTFRIKNLNIPAFELMTQWYSYINTDNDVILTPKEKLTIALLRPNHIVELLNLELELCHLAKETFRSTSNALHYSLEAFVTRSTIMCVPIKRQQPEKAKDYPDLQDIHTSYIASIELLAQTRTYLQTYPDTPAKAFKQGYRGISEIVESLRKHHQEIPPLLEFLYNASLQLEAIRHPTSPEHITEKLTDETQAILSTLDHLEKNKRTLHVLDLISQSFDAPKGKLAELDQSLQSKTPNNIIDPTALAAPLHSGLLEVLNTANHLFACCG
jgi:hypothetical protein